ncbi:polysaccharide biosynthesis C-terminal domain-containing protein [Planctomycetota bacterium]|nr:polysaccharide biosynthesis C-terminal domain-containing protein [Planctomycetota bacterium]
MTDTGSQQPKTPHLLPRIMSVALINGIGAIFLLVLNFILARKLGKDGVGIYNYAWAWIEVVVVFSTLGLNKLAMRDVAYHVTHNAWTKLRGLLIGSTAMLTASAVIASGLLAVVFYFFLDNVFELIFLQAVLLGLAVIPFRSLAFHFYGILLGLRKSMQAQIPMFIGQPFFTIIIFLIIMWYYGISQITGLSAVTASMLSALLVALISLVISFKYIPREVLSVKSEYTPIPWLKVAMPMMFMASMALINIRADIIMIGLLGRSDDLTGEVGVYTIASRCSELIRFGILAVNPVIVGLIAKHHATKQHDKLKHVVKSSARYLLFGALASVAALYFFGQPILSIFGSGFEVGYTALMILAIGQFMTIALGPVDATLIMTGHHHIALIGLLIATIVNLILNAVLIPQFGMTGAAIATATSATIWSTILAMAVVKKLHFRPFAFF